MAKLSANRRLMNLIEKHGKFQQPSEVTNVQGMDSFYYVVTYKDMLFIQRRKDDAFVGYKSENKLFDHSSMSSVRAFLNVEMSNVGLAESNYCWIEQKISAK